MLAWSEELAPEEISMGLLDRILDRDDEDDDDFIDGCEMGDLGELRLTEEQEPWIPLFCAVDWRNDRDAVLDKAREWRELFGAMR